MVSLVREDCRKTARASNMSDPFIRRGGPFHVLRIARPETSAIIADCRFTIAEKQREWPGNRKPVTGNQFIIPT
jgi:hypothetical protein